MTNFYSSKGVIHQQGSVESPQQNSIVEHKHQHLLNILSFQANLPLMCWRDCALTATHIINRIPTLSLSNKSPFLFPYTLSPSIFGCLCYCSTLLRNRTKLLLVV